eukprot:73908_1
MSSAPPPCSIGYSVKPTRTNSDLYTFRRRDTYLHTFGAKNGDKIIRMIYHPLTICLLCLHGIVCFMLSWTGLLLFKIQQYSIDIAWCVFCVNLWIWLIFGILSVNRAALRVIATKFDFWVKVLFANIFIVSYNIWTFNHTDIQHVNWIVIHLLRAALSSIDFILIIIYYSLISGMQIKFKTKLYFGILLSVFCTIFATQYMFFSENHKHHTSEYSPIYHEYLSVSFYSISLSSIQIITLFLWKTVYLSRKCKQKSTVANNTLPSIRWVSDPSVTYLSSKQEHGAQKQRNSLESNEGDDRYLDCPSEDMHNTKPLPLSFIQMMSIANDRDGLEDVHQTEPLNLSDIESFTPTRIREIADDISSLGRLSRSRSTSL